jgi:hypothetical protein
VRSPHQVGGRQVGVRSTVVTVGRVESRTVACRFGSRYAASRV